MLVLDNFGLTLSRQYVPCNGLLVQSSKFMVTSTTSFGLVLARSRVGSGCETLDFKFKAI